MLVTPLVATPILLVFLAILLLQGKGRSNGSDGRHDTPD